MKILAVIKKCKSNYSTKSKYYGNENKLVIGKMKHNRRHCNSRIYWIEAKKYIHSWQTAMNIKKQKSVNRYAFATISHNEYKNVLSNNKCLRHSMNRIQCKDNRTGPYEIKKILLSCLDDKIYTQNNGYDELTLGCQS